MSIVQQLDIRIRYFFLCSFSSVCSFSLGRGARCYDYRFLSALLKRTAAITQADLGSQTLQSGTVAFKTLRCVIEFAYIFVSLKAITVKFLVWENTIRKELQNPLS